MITTNMLKIQGHPVGIFTEEPSPVLPADMDFVFLARNFDGTKIPNSAVNGYGPANYLAQGTLTVNGSGSSCYLTNGYSNSNYLYATIESSQLEAMKANNGTYTYFIRVMAEADIYNVGGILSWRANGSYIYMIRSYNGQLQIHTNSGSNLGNNFLLTTDRVYKVQVSGNNYYAKNLDTGDTWANTYSGTKNMGTTMTTFYAGYSYGLESYLQRFYAVAGIGRATTEEEDTSIKNYLMSQGL